MLEREIERNFVKQIEALGGVALKITVPGQRGFPDRLVLFPVPPEHQELVAHYVRFVELKQPGQRARPSQVTWIVRLLTLGFNASVRTQAGEK